MKAVGILTDSPNNNNNNTTAISNGRVAKSSRHRDNENEEVQMYLSKLRDLVPFKPRGRRLSNLEVIQNVIDYICDLQTALEAHPSSAAAAGAVGAFDAAAVLSRGSGPLNGPPKTATTPARQPLGVRSSTPNTILHHQQIMDHINTSASSSLSQATTEKQQSPSSPSPPDGRSVSSSC